MSQNRKPCKTCAFRRDIEPGLTGGSRPEVYVGQTAAGMWIPCHETYVPGLHAKQQLPGMANECAGSAVYRANTGCKRIGPILELPPNKELVFATHAEFLAHHYEVNIAEAEDYLREVPPSVLALHELGKGKVLQKIRTVTTV